jgi:hypothetical protein
VEDLLDQNTTNDEYGRICTRVYFFKICLVFFRAHPERKKPGGYMINVYIYKEERDMIYDYICM